MWRRERTLHFSDESVQFQERYYLVLVSQAEVVLENLLPQERQVYRGHKWWSLQQMEHSSEVFLPFGLQRLLRPIIAGHVPDTPLILEE